MSKLFDKTTIKTRMRKADPNIKINSCVLQFAKSRSKLKIIALKIGIHVKGKLMDDGEQPPHQKVDKCSWTCEFCGGCVASDRWISQTAWFVESIFTQTLVIFVIRTRTVPFFKSKPNKWLTINIVGLLLVAIMLPYTILGKIFKLIPLPLSFLFITVGFIVVYLFLVEMMKIWFYRKFADK